MSVTSGKQPERRVWRRRSVKRSVRMTCQLGSMGLGPNIALSACDVSEVAARFVAKVALAAGQEVEMSFLGPGRNRPLKRMAKIVWCVQRDPSTWWTVARFDQRIEYADFQYLVG
jgi:hypothetical protein